MDLDRRSFLKRSSIAAAVAGTASAAGIPLLAGLTPAAAAGEAATDSAANDVLPADATLDSPVVAQLGDIQKGEVHVYVGERQITLHDRKLASQLFRASR